MRKIAKILSKSNKTSAKGSSYILYNYQLDDGSTVKSITRFDIGERVEVWFDHQYNVAKLKKHVPKKAL